MNKISAVAFMLLSTVAVCVVGVVSCGGQTAAPQQDPFISGQAALPPPPDESTQMAYIDALNRIDPDIVHGDVEKAVDRGRDTCVSIETVPEDRLVQLTNARFTSPNHPDGFGLKKAEKILAAIRKYICSGGHHATA